MITMLKCQNCKAGYEYVGPKLRGTPLIVCPHCEQNSRASIILLLNRGDADFTPLPEYQRPPKVEYRSEKTQDQAGGWERPIEPKPNLPMPEMSTEEQKAFWEHIKAAGPDQCWKWRRGFDGAGYGRFHLRKRKYYARRIAYWLVLGTDPGQKTVLNSCGEPACCNPKHLVLAEC